MLNQITVMGRLTRDPELRRTASGVAVASFSIACDRDYADKNTKERETDFFDCVAWNKLGESIAKHFSKGRMAVVSGRMENRRWTDKEGNKRLSMEIHVDNIYFADSKHQNGDNQQQSAGNAGYTTPGYAAPSAAPASNASGYSGFPAPAPSYSGAAVPHSDYALMDNDDANLPF